MRWIGLFVFLLTVYFPQGLWSDSSFEPIDLSGQGWEYRWGDSPLKNGQPLWIDDSMESPHWKPIEFPSNPEEREGQTNVWYRITLPETLPDDPHLYIYSIDLITETYLGGKMIYHFGDFDAQGQGRFQGWPWHMIALPKDAAGKPIYFRIYSDATDIGLWGEVLIASKGYHLEKMYHEDMPYLVVGSVTTLLAFLFIVAYVFQIQKIEFLLLGLLFLTQGLDQLLGTRIIQLFFDHPLTKQYLLVITYTYLPFGIAAFMDKIMGPGHYRLIRRIWQLHLVFLVLSVSGALLGFYGVSDIYPLFDFLFYFVTWPVLTVVALLALKNKDYEARIVVAGFMLISVFWLYSTLIAWNLVPWEDPPIYIPMFLCLLMFGYVLIRRLLKLDELELANGQLHHAQSALIQLNKNLEQRVAEEIAKRQEHEHLLMQQSKMATMGEMVGAISHQLTQPLTIMSLTIEYIKEESPQHCNQVSFMESSLGKLMEQIRHMSETIRHFKKFLKPSENPVFFEACDVVKEVQHLLDYQLKHFEIDMVIEEHENFTCVGYPSEMRHVILNIINNAKDVFLERNIQGRKIIASCATEAGRGVISIRDNAGGIVEELLPDKLFQAYVTTKGEQGTGIGLQLSKTIIENRMNGKIRARNVHEGAEFVIELPQAYQ